MRLPSLRSIWLSNSVNDSIGLLALCDLGVNDLFGEDVAVDDLQGSEPDRHKQEDWYVAHHHQQYAERESRHHQQEDSD